MTRDEARDYFKQYNLTYSDIGMDELYKLIQLLNMKIAKASSCMVMILEPKLKGQNKNVVLKNGKLMFAAIRVKGYYFDNREAITFNKNGFIGFCAWASDDNTFPFTEAFKEWVDYLRKGKKR